MIYISTMFLYMLDILF